MKQGIHIDENNITIGRYILYTLSAYMKAWWWAYALPLVVCFALSFKNINFLFAAIILVFIVFNMIQFMVVIYYGLVPESRYSILPKMIDFNEEGILLNLKKKIYKEEYLNENFEDEDIPDYAIENAQIPWGKIKGIIAKDECLLLMFKTPRYSFFAIPYSAFTSEEHLRDAVLFIRSNLG